MADMVYAVYDYYVCTSIGGSMEGWMEGWMHRYRVVAPVVLVFSFHFFVRSGDVFIKTFFKLSMSQVRKDKKGSFAYRLSLVAQTNPSIQPRANWRM